MCVHSVWIYGMLLKIMLFTPLKLLTILCFSKLQLTIMEEDHF